MRGSEEFALRGELSGTFAITAPENLRKPQKLSTIVIQQTKLLWPAGSLRMPQAVPFEPIKC
jgi:hypothetical protein